MNFHSRSMMKFRAGEAKPVSKLYTLSAGNRRIQKQPEVYAYTSTASDSIKRGAPISPPDRQTEIRHSSSSGVSLLPWNATRAACKSRIR